ncbi:hypothetical protein EV401DRAFT_983389 [Pisolithus croceorrhizus]|nr:hypothetical protein EV401DRAFT_983389 [Pisolithus croceorrhizus]
MNVNVVWREPLTSWSCAVSFSLQRVLQATARVVGCPRVFHSKWLIFFLCLEARRPSGLVLSTWNNWEFFRDFLPFDLDMSLSGGQNLGDHFARRSSSRFSGVPSKPSTGILDMCALRPLYGAHYRSHFLFLGHLRGQKSFVQLNISALECIQTHSLSPAKQPGPPKISSRTEIDRW